VQRSISGTSNDGHLPFAAPDLAIGPLNTAGQATEWAAAARCHGQANAFSFARRNPTAETLTGAADRSFEGSRYPRYPHRRKRVQYLVDGATHLLTESLEPLLGTLSISMSRKEVRELTLSGSSVGNIFHGTDIRNLDRHEREVENSFVTDLTRGRRLRLQLLRNHRFRRLRQLQIPCFVSTPDLLADVPNATWLPLVVKQSRWRVEGRQAFGGRPRVLFRPTSPIKGTSVILPVLKRLHTEQRIQFIDPGLTDHSEMPHLLSNVDIVVDQIRTGSYGVSAVEAMAAGCLCIGYVTPEVRDALPTSLPIVDAPTRKFSDVMHEILADPDQFLPLAAAGPTFVEQVHNGERSAQVLSDFVGA
jgi:hypothetical protein